MRLEFGSAVDCAGEPYGELADLVIDPDSRRVTHLVVQPHHQHDSARLVSIELVQASGDEDDPAVSLDCSVAEISELEPVQRSVYLRLGERPVEAADSDVGIEQDFELPPYQSLGPNALGSGVGPLDVDPHATVSYDRIPKGMVEVRRESEVTSSEGDYVGHVVGFVIGDEERMTELVIEHGHLWAKRKTALPSASIERIESDEVVLTVPADEVGR